MNPYEYPLQSSNHWLSIMDRLLLKLTQSEATPSNVPSAEYVDIFYPNIQVHRVISATHKKCSYFIARLEQLIATTTSGARKLIPHPYSIRTTNSTNTLQQLLRRLNTCDVRWGLWVVNILFYRRRKRRNKKHYNMQWQSGQREQWFLYTEPHCNTAPANDVHFICINWRVAAINVQL